MKLLKRRIAEVAHGTFAPRAERVTFGELAELLRVDYRLNGRRSLDRAERAVAHLREVFGLRRAVDITRDRVDAYITARLNEAAPATVRAEVSALQRMFVLAVRAGKLQTSPKFTRLRIENTRTTAFTETELQAVLDVLREGRPATTKDRAVKAQPELVPPILFAALTGWRLHSEVLPLEWRRVDLTAGTVALEIGRTKSGKARVFPFGVVPRLAALLAEQREATTALERQTGRIFGHVFHRGGRPIRSFHEAWVAACARAGVPGRWVHDLRRTGARSLRSLGMSDRDIAELCGWDTIEMVTRYLGPDPTGVADRLRARIAESAENMRTKYGTNGNATAAGEK